ncbi:MAG: UPF0175 family protein [Campylobacterales bacterium]
MLTVGIKELKDNPAILTRSLEAHDISLLTKRGSPIGLALPWDDAIFANGYKETLAVNAYKAGLLTLSQLARTLGKSLEETLDLTAQLGILLIDHDAAETDREIEAARTIAGE